MLFNAFQPGLYSVDIARFDVAAALQQKMRVLPQKIASFQQRTAEFFVLASTLTCSFRNGCFVSTRLGRVDQRGDTAGRFKDRFEIVKLIKCIYQFTCGDMLLNAF